MVVNRDIGIGLPEETSSADPRVINDFSRLAVEIVASGVASAPDGMWDSACRPQPTLQPTCAGCMSVLA